MNNECLSFRKTFFAMSLSHTTNGRVDMLILVSTLNKNGTTWQRVSEVSHDLLEIFGLQSIENLLLGSST
jgi:hypothetical protein